MRETDRMTAADNRMQRTSVPPVAARAGCSIPRGPARLSSPRSGTSPWISGDTGGGPMLVEIDTSGAFTLPQLASGRGFLIEEVRAFFRDCGYARV